VRCADCSLVQLDYIVPQTETFPPEYPYVTGITKLLCEHFRAQARWVASITRHGDLVVDIGGNDGTMLGYLHQEWMGADGKKSWRRCLLVEPTDQADKCPDGIIVAKAYFTSVLARELAEQHGVAQVITASNVFGHVPDPHDFLDGCYELLAPDGTLIIDNQDWYNVIQDLQIDTIYHEHLRYFSPASISQLLSREGFLVTSVNRIPMHGGSFRVTAVKEKTDLEHRANDLLIKLRNTVKEAADQGPVYAVTAPTRATPLVNASGIGEYLTMACEISSSEKIGGYIPGTTVQILDEERLFTDQPPTAILLAWDLRHMLIPKLRERGYHGDIIIPLPVPHTDRVVDDEC
jgi:SAM-dependent methyltransferase